MLLEQGPPGATGVKSLQYVGDADLVAIPTATVAAGAFLIGYLLGKGLTRMALYAGAGALVVKYLVK